MYSKKNARQGRHESPDRIWRYMHDFSAASLRLNHTSYLSFLLHWQDFWIPIFYTKKLQQIALKKCKICSFSHPIWKNLHWTEFFYTGTACSACDKYEVCILYIVLGFEIWFDVLCTWCWCIWGLDVGEHYSASAVWWLLLGCCCCCCCSLLMIVVFVYPAYFRYPWFALLFAQP